MDEPNTGFGELSNTELVAKAQLVASSLSRSPGLEYFPAPIPTIVELLAAAKELGDLLGQENSTVVTALRAKARKDLVALLKKLAVHVALVADGDVTKLAATGFDLRRKATRSNTPLPAPMDFEVKHTGISTEAKGRCKPVANASSYETEYALSPDGPWIRGGVFTNSRKLMFTGLTRGKDYYFRVRAIGAAGPGAWSDISSIMII